MDLDCSWADTEIIGDRLATERKSIGDWSGWDYLPGIAFIMVGVLAVMMAPLTSLAIGTYIGSMLCVAGGFAFVVDLALGVLILTMDPQQAFTFLGYYVGISFIFRGLWTSVFVGEAHEIGHGVREALA